MQAACHRHAHSNRSRAEKGERRRILVVEPDDFQAVLVERMFLAFGVRDVERISLLWDAAAMAAASDDAPDLIIWGASPSTFIDFLRSNPTGGTIPVLVIAADRGEAQSLPGIDKRFRFARIIPGPMTFCDVRQICKQWAMASTPPPADTRTADVPQLLSTPFITTPAQCAGCRP